MAISTTTRTAGPFQGNGTTTVFPFTFKVFATTDLYVVSVDAEGDVSLLVLNTDYVATLNANQDTSAGGSITLTNPLATGTILLITSDVQQLQQTVLTNSGGFYPDVLNGVFDRLTILVQQLQAQANQAIRLGLTDDTTSAQLPPAAQRAGTVLGFDGNGAVELIAAVPPGAAVTATARGLAAGSSPSVTVIETANAYALAFGIPAGATGAPGPAGPAVTFIPSGAWASGVTYPLNALVGRNGNGYASLIAGNVGNDPATDTTHWMLLVSNTASTLALSTLNLGSEVAISDVSSASPYAPLAAEIDDYGRTAMKTQADGSIVITKLRVPSGGTTPLLSSLLTQALPSTLKQHLLSNLGGYAYAGVMASPPTLTLTLQPGYVVTSSISGAMLDPWNSTRARNLYAIPTQYNGNPFLCGTGTNEGSGNTQANACTAFGREFDHTGSVLEVFLRGNGTRVRVFVNGQLVNPLPALSLSGTLTSGQQTLTGVSNAASIVVGASISGTGIQDGCTVTGYSGTTVNLSLPATASGAQTLATSGQCFSVPSDGNYYLLKIAFGSTATRLIRIEGDSGFVYGGLYLEPTATVAYPSGIEPATVTFGGDSYIEGLTGSNYPASGMAHLLGKRFGWNIHGIGVGSTGLLNPGTSPHVNFNTRVADWSVPNVALGIVMLSINDFGAGNPSELAWTGAPTTWDGIVSVTYAAMTTFIQAYQAGAPGVPLIVIGPTWKDGDAIPQCLFPYRDAARSACAAFAGVYFIDQLLDNLLLGDGNIGAPNGTGNCDFIVNSDGVHPSQAGHEYRAGVLFDKILNLIETRF